MTKKNHRQNRKSLPRKHNTKLSLSTKTRCGFNFTIRCTKELPLRLYVAGGIGSNTHTHHLKFVENTLITRHKSSIPQKALDHLHDLSEYSIYCSVNQSLHLL